MRGEGGKLWCEERRESAGLNERGKDEMRVVVCERWRWMKLKGWMMQHDAVNIGSTVLAITFYSNVEMRKFFYG